MVKIVVLADKVSSIELYDTGHVVLLRVKSLWRQVLQWNESEANNSRRSDVGKTNKQSVD